MPAFDIIAIIALRPLAGSRLWVKFNDGTEGTIDFADVFRDRGLTDLNAPEEFARAVIAGGGVAWPGGFDCSPEWLHERVRAGIQHSVQQNGDDWDALHRHAPQMPEVSRFFGIVIRMSFADHARPHFHAEYGEYLISVEIDGDGVHGRFPPSRLPMLFEWRDRHRAELLANWDRLQRGQPALPVPPLT